MYKSNGWTSMHDKLPGLTKLNQFLTRMPKCRFQIGAILSPYKLDNTGSVIAAKGLWFTKQLKGLHHLLLILPQNIKRKHQYSPLYNKQHRFSLFFFLFLFFVKLNPTRNSYKENQQIFPQNAKFQKSYCLSQQPKMHKILKLR